MKKTNRGFTLIELLVAVAIIGILTAIIIPNLNNARVKARDAKRISDLKSIQLALSVYYDTHRSTGYLTNIYSTTANARLAPEYMPVVPKDPKNGSNYAYTAIDKDGDTSRYEAYCLGTDLEGTPPSGEDSLCTVGVTDYTVEN